MTGSKLARRMAIAGGISVSEAQRLEDALTQILIEQVSQGETVRLQGLGSLGMMTRSRQAWNPKKQKKIRRKQRRAIKWKASKSWPR